MFRSRKERHVTVLIRDIVKNRKLLVAGHRGYSAKYPENTLLSVRKGIEAGVDMIEIDIALSKDGVPVLCHDDTLDRTTTGTGLVNAYTLAELRALDAGIKRGSEFAGLQIPTFEELCELMQEHPNVLLNVDLKYGEHVLRSAELVLEIIEKYNMSQRCVFNSLDGRATMYTHKRGLFTEGAPKGFYGMSNFDDSANGTYAAMDVICINMRDVSNESVAHYKSMGLPVWCWGAESEETIRRAVDSGISLLVCNDPNIAVKIRDEMNAIQE